MPDLEKALQENRETAVDCAAILADLVRILRPARVVESGTYPGTSTKAIAEALPEGSMLYTYERVDNLAALMFERFRYDHPNVSVHRGGPPSFDLCLLAFLDSGPAYEDRLYDFLTWKRSAPVGSICLLDDADEAWFRHLRVESVILPTHTGLAIVRQPRI